MTQTSNLTPYVRDLRRIWVGARALGMDSDTLHELVKNITNKDSLKKLSQLERTKVIKDLESKGAYRYKKKTPKPHTSNLKPRGRATDIITREQQEHIHKLWVALAEYGDQFARPNWQGGFINRILGKVWPQKKWEAQKVIEALKSRLAQERKKINHRGAEGKKG